MLYFIQESTTKQMSLCPSKREREKCFKKGAEDKFVVEVRRKFSKKSSKMTFFHNFCHFK